MECNHDDGTMEVIREPGQPVRARLICSACGEVIDLYQRGENRIGVDQFSHELHGLISRHGMENDLTYAEIVGVLTMAAYDNDREREALWQEKEEDDDILGSSV